MSVARSILYVGQLWEGGTCGERLKTLRRLGNRIVPFDTTRFVRLGNALTQTLAHRANWGEPVTLLNRELIKFVGGLETTISHVWIDKGKWIRPETLTAIRNFTRGQLIHFTLDAQLLENRSRFFNAAIPVYDCVITTKPFETEIYKDLGAKRLVLTIQGFDDRFFPRKPSPKDLDEYGAEVAFIGHCQQHYARVLHSISKSGIGLRVWGPGWTGYARRHRWARSHVCGDGLWGEAYPKALSCAKIGLGLLSKRIPETSTTRSFEIPASEVLLLAERTDEHRRLFREGTEADYFSSDAELLSKIRYYLAEDSRRVLVARAGRERCMRDGYACKEILSSLLARIDEFSGN